VKVVYVLPHAGRCGGIRVIGEHASRLAARGHDTQVWGFTGSFAGWFPRPVKHRLFPHTDQLGAALQGFTGVKVATIPQTASWVASNLLPGEKGFYLAQDDDARTYSGDGSGSSYRHGLTVVTEGEYVTADLRERYGVEAVNVGIGYDHRVFYPLPMTRDRLRVLTPYRPHAGGGDLKGWGLALDTWRRVHAGVPGASLVTFGDSPKPPGVPGPHIHLSAPTDAKLREVYSQSGVFLHTAKHEGFGLPMLEAMACGLPVVCTDSHGNREFCRDGDTAVVKMDGDGLAAGCAAVMADGETFGRLATAGLNEAKRYRWEPVIDRLEQVYGLTGGAG
jgi:glycosyltransferase involved in cell wall biosynthesis